MSKYIQMKDGRIIDLSDYELDEEDKIYRYYISRNCAFRKLVRKDDISEYADSVKELCDVYIIVSKTIVPEHSIVTYEQALEAFKTLKEDKAEFAIYGAVWTELCCDQPILKSVVRMQSILPNGDIDWRFFC